MTCIPATLILLLSRSSSIAPLLSQGNSHASPQLDDNFLGTGTMRVFIPAALQVLSNIKAELVVLKVARQVCIFYKYPLRFKISAAFCMCLEGIFITGPVQPIALSA